MKNQRRRASIIVVHDSKVLGFHAEDPCSKRMYFFLPGGMVEEGENPVQTAQRETLEETGYSVEVIAEIHLLRRYDFLWSGRVNDCETHFFAGRLVSETPLPVNDASYHRGVGWVPVSEIGSVFSYHPDIRQAVELIVDRLSYAVEDGDS